MKHRIARHVLNTFLIAAMAAAANADDAVEIDLWPDGVPEPTVAMEPAEELRKGDDGRVRRFNVSRPRMFMHVPAQPSGAAMLIVPGGGFARLADEHEGSDVAAWLVSHGITAFQLAYRTPTNKQPNPVMAPAQDVQKAIAKIRLRSAEWNVDPDRIGVIGFSAGGQATLVAAGSPPLIPGATSATVLKPNAMLLIYPYQVMDPATHQLRADVDADSGLPPTFIAQAADDKSSDPAGSVLLFNELRTRCVPVELHIYEIGGHGFGMRPRDGMPGTGDWPHRAIDWLRIHKFVSTN